MQQAPLNLLIIEDQKFCTDLFQAAFKEHNILIAHSGEIGIKMYKDKKPDIVFLDIGLVDIPGFEVLERLRKQDKKAYVVMLSGMNNEAYIKKCKALGAIGFLSKPYQKDYIQYYIDRFQSERQPLPVKESNSNNDADSW